MTESSCSALVPTLNGNSVYSVYYGPFSSANEACGARTGDSSYVKVLDNVSDPDDAGVSCE